MATACTEIQDALRGGEISIHRAWLWRERPSEYQRRALMLYRGEKGVKKTIRRLISKHMSKNAISGREHRIRRPHLQRLWPTQRPSPQFGCRSSGGRSRESSLYNRRVASTLASPEGIADFMRCREPLKQILIGTRDCWDHPGSRPSVRENFSQMIDCKTPASGAEIFASTNEEKLVYHTCKSRACPSCGHRATLLWQREQWAALPDIRYAGIALTMPDVLWSIFQQNRHLLHDLPALGTVVIQQWVRGKFGARAC